MPFSTPKTEIYLLQSQEPRNEFTGHFFKWRLRSIGKFWIQNYFCAIPVGWDFCKTKLCSETSKFIFILTHNGPESPEMNSSCPGRPLTRPDWSWKPKIYWKAFSYPKWTTSFQFVFISINFQITTFLRNNILFCKYLSCLKVHIKWFYSSDKKKATEIYHFRPQKFWFICCKNIFYNEIPFGDLILLELAQKLQSSLLRNKITWQGGK